MAEETNKKTSILIVDDDKFLQNMYAAKFSKENFETAVAGSGQEAIDILNKGLKPDIFLVDIVMPNMDGFQLVEKIRQMDVYKTCTLIILSNLGQKEDIERGLNLGADGYIVKASATPSEVVNKVFEIVSNKKR